MLLRKSLIKYIGALAFMILLQSTLLIAQTSLNKAPITISSSTVIKKAEYQLAAPKNDDAVVTISGDNIVVDFNGAVLKGSKKPSQPDEFTGLALHIKGGKNITIKNAIIKGYKMAILAENVKNLTLENCDLSYNYRPLLRSQREYEDYADWLSYHQNEKGEWKNKGAGIYLDNCDSAVLKNIVILQGFNGIMMNQCSNSLVFNSSIMYNSGVGIGLYRSSKNQIMHNKIDWNVRGHSHGFYKRGQDSAGILVYEQSNNNVFAYNSVTHSGDGFFLWAGQSTMDTGKGGCNDNLIYGNDFSHAPTNGIELTFSRNVVYNNIINGCENGIWGGYSFNTIIFANKFDKNNRDIAIEHGQENSIRLNLFNNSKTGIGIWQNKDQQDWAYARSKDCSSRIYDIERNHFANVANPLNIHSSSDITISYNQVNNAKELLHETNPNNNLVFKNNDIRLTDNWGAAEKYKPENINSIKSAVTPSPNQYGNRIYVPAPIPGGYMKDNKVEDPYTVKDIIINKWGPYNYTYPLLYLAEKNGNEYTFKIFGPNGSWRVRSMRGLILDPIKDPVAPMTFKARAKTPGKMEDIYILIEWKGEAFVDQFGELQKPGTAYLLKYAFFDPKLKWNVSLYQTPEILNISNPEIAAALVKNQPNCRDTVSNLRYAWWSSPCKEITNDKFISKAESRNYFEPAEYTIYLTSDDGVVLYIDNKEIFRNWNIHESTTDKITMHLEGEHSFKILYFNGGGFGNLSWRMEKN